MSASCWLCCPCLCGASLRAARPWRQAASASAVAPASPPQQPWPDQPRQKLRLARVSQLAVGISARHHSRIHSRIHSLRQVLEAIAAAPAVPRVKHAHTRALRGARCELGPTIDEARIHSELQKVLGARVVVRARNVSVSVGAKERRERGNGHARVDSACPLGKQITYVARLVARGGVLKPKGSDARVCGRRGWGEGTRYARGCARACACADTRTEPQERRERDAREQQEDHERQMRAVNLHALRLNAAGDDAKGRTRRHHAANHHAAAQQKRRVDGPQRRVLRRANIRKETKNQTTEGRTPERETTGNSRMNAVFLRIVEAAADRKAVSAVEADHA
eukprot:1226705-Pleurochrysis_carterae.AAC.1